MNEKELTAISRIDLEIEVRSIARNLSISYGVIGVEYVIQRLPAIAREYAAEYEKYNPATRLGFINQESLKVE